MTAVYTLNLVDRGLIMLLLQPIKEDLHLSDTQLGLLTGIAFGLFYAVAGVPLARWADRGNRVTIASWAIGLWGVTVMACVLVSNYSQLVLARIAAAVGEAGCKPPTYSLIGDYFPDALERTRAMSVYWLGNAFSALIAFILGGWLNELYGWRITFFLVGIPGIALAIVLKLTVVEPRELRPRVETMLRPAPSIASVLMTLWQQRSTRHLTFALVLFYTLAFGMGPWYAAFLIRSHGMSTAELGFWLGSIIGLGGVGGTLLGGYVSNRWFAGDESGQMRTTAWIVSSLVFCFLAFLTLPGKYHALMALIPLMLVLNFFFAPTYALMQRLVADDVRATTMAIVMLVANVIGMGIGPQLVGILSDALTPAIGSDGLRYAMLTMSFLAIWSAYHFWEVSRTVDGDLSVIACRAIGMSRETIH